MSQKTRTDTRPPLLLWFRLLLILLPSSPLCWSLTWNCPGRTTLGQCNIAGKTFAASLLLAHHWNINGGVRPNILLLFFCSTVHQNRTHLLFRPQMIRIFFLRLVFVTLNFKKARNYVAGKLFPKVRGQNVTFPRRHYRRDHHLMTLSGWGRPIKGTNWETSPGWLFRVHLMVWLELLLPSPR